MVAASVTSQWPTTNPSTSSASGSTRFFRASPWYVKASSAPWAWQALAMPQAMDRLLATPMIRPRFPRMRPAGSAIFPRFAGAPAGRPYVA